MGLIPEMESAARLTLGYPMTFESLGEGVAVIRRVGTVRPGSLSQTLQRQPRVVFRLIL
jgi:hypothetical protein